MRLRMVTENKVRGVKFYITQLFQLQICSKLSTTKSLSTFYDRWVMYQIMSCQLTQPPAAWPLLHCLYLDQLEERQTPAPWHRLHSHPSETYWPNHTLLTVCNYSFYKPCPHFILEVKCVKVTAMFMAHVLRAKKMWLTTHKTKQTAVYLTKQYVNNM